MESTVPPSPTRLRFADLELDAATCELRVRGRSVAIEPKPFALLFYLARNAGRVVSREELMEAVWPDVKVGGSALHFALHRARRALRENHVAEDPIRTVSRRGYRFVAAPAPLGQGRDPAAPKARSRARSPFVGRCELLERMDALLGDVRAGRPRTLLVAGEAGVGKSRSVEELAAIARRAGFRVFTGRCVEAEGAPVFWPWIQIVREIARTSPAEDLLDALGDGAPDIVRMVPELRARMPLPDRAAPTDPEAARFLLFDAVTTLFRRLAEASPLVLILDDLHRADQPTLLLLRHLAGSLGDARCLLAGTYRQTELHLAARGAGRSVAAVAREPGTVSTELAGLSIPELAELVRRLFDRELSPRTGAHLREITAGNPFFVLQVLRVLEDRDRLAELETPGSLELELPRGVQDAIAHHLEILPEPCRELLEVASVIGREFELEDLRCASGWSREKVLDALRTALPTRIFAEPAPGIYRFAHVLLRDALYQRLDATRRARLHARVGAALEELRGSEAGGHCVALSHHFYQALGVGEADRALRYAELAGRWACDQVAFEEAPAQFERALEVLDRLQPEDAERRFRLLLALGDALIKSGGRGRAREILLEAAALAEQLNDAQKLASAALRFAPDFVAIQAGVFDADLVRLLERALATLGDADEALRARLLSRLAVALHWCNERVADCRRYAAEAVAAAERVGDPGTIAFVRTGEMLASYSVVRPERYLEVVREGSPIAGDEPNALLRQLLRLTSLLHLGRVAEVHEATELFAALAAKLRQQQLRWYADLVRTVLHLMKGSYAEARESSQRYVADGSRGRDRNVQQSYVYQTVLASFDLGGVEATEGVLKQTVEAFPRVACWSSVLALFYAEQGRFEEARKQVAYVARSGAIDGPTRTDYLATVVALAFAFRAPPVVSPTVARDLYRRLLPLQDRLAVVGYLVWCWGSMHHPLGVLASALGRWDDAEDHFERALRVNQAIGARPQLAWTQYDYAATLLRARQRPQHAGRLLGSAIDSSCELGLERLAAKARALAGRA